MYPCIPQFLFIKVGFKGVFIARICFPDEMKNLYIRETCLLYSETRVYGGIYHFSFFVQKHRVWVLIRTALLRGF